MLKLTDVNSYYDTAHILQGVSLTVRSGEVAAILGRNGIGKSTLARTILGLQPPVLRSGNIQWKGTHIAGRPPHEISQLGIGYVPQGRRVFGSLTVQENLMLGARGAHAAGWTLESLYELFPRLRERHGSRARNLSGGEQQMLAIARALIINPGLVVMDEPSEGLAPIRIAEVRDRLARLKGTELSILLIEQNLGLVLSLADRIYVLGGTGVIVWEGTPAELDADAGRKERLLGVSGTSVSTKTTR